MLAIFGGCLRFGLISGDTWSAISFINVIQISWLLLFLNNFAYCFCFDFDGVIVKESFIYAFISYHYWWYNWLNKRDNYLMESWYFLFLFFLRQGSRNLLYCIFWVIVCIFVRMCFSFNINEDYDTILIILF